ncbi:tyrosine-type recombinase/integrase [Halodesulfurarchaeum formicicum]|uniref:Integrase n=1 Tax=Halodesulfurarchaeum formicicum TaxID=1873524 RepID=A0A1J1AD64_9EURY|nr:hypothetical protein [Halodesulfurarchaeum formicicum]APE95715.1 integrase [Halodesulfurarchaeum formicicum]
MTKEPNKGYHDWNHDLNALQQVGEEIIEEWEQERPQSTRDYPPVQWMADNGYSHLRWILREKHDMGTPEFFILLTSAGGTQEYEWKIDDVATIERVKTYINDRIDCRGWGSTTTRTQRAQINEILHRFATEYGDDKLITIANNPELQTEVYESFKEVVKRLREDLTSDNSAHHYVRAGHRFFEWLDRSNRIAYDPMENIEEEFRWEWKAEPTPLSPEQVRKLWIAAETPEERMLVVGYCIWGLRTKELPAIHIDQIFLDAHDPHIKFDEADRKNGEGQVSLIFGLDAFADLVENRAMQPSWNGYLFPSDNENRSALTGKQMRRRFKRLARKAGVKIDGDVPTPKHGRAFFYNIQADAESVLLEMAGAIAEEQGAKDAKAVRDAYLSPEKRRKYRRIFFRRQIRQVLPEDANTGYRKRIDSDSSLADFM